MEQDTPVVIVTGASKGMGRETARWLAAAGSAVVCAARSVEALQALVGQIRENGGRALAAAVDVSDFKQCEEAVGKTIETFGRIDALINNAGVLDPIAPLAEADPGAWVRNIAVNLLGPYYLIRAALPQLRKTAGRVVNISSGAAVDPIAGWSGYCASKAGITHLTRVLAAEETRITAVCLRPGVVDTDMQARIREMGPKHMKPEKTAYFQELKESGKLEAPSVPARSAAWLALHAPHSWSGEFVEYNESRITTAAGRAFPDVIG